MERRKLWELDTHLHCLVIGTCATVKELRQLGRKAGLAGADTLDAYALHHSFVRIAGEAAPPTRLLHKRFEQKFRACIRRFSSAVDTSQLQSLWEQSVATGEIAGPFWAILTHPLADVALIGGAFGEIHMLSHLAGHSNHATQRELVQAQRRIARLEEQLSAANAAARLRRTEHARTVATLTQRMQEAAASEQALAAARTRIAELENETGLAALHQENTRLREEQDRTLARLRRAERDARQWAAVAFAAEASHSRSPTISPDTDTTAPVGAPGCVREPKRCQAARAGNSPPACGTPDLCGRCILYVGGRDRQMAHFRLLVESCNGRFVHHDGGRAEAIARLNALIRRADAVLCPVDCVSHEACLQIKKLCKRTAKPFVMLRSASLAAFARGLGVLGAQA